MYVDSGAEFVYLSGTLGKPSKMSFNKEIILKGGRGSIWKVKNKEIFARREGVRVEMSLLFTQF